MKDFYVSLNSKNAQIGSTADDFTSILAKSIELKGNWEFALTEIYFGEKPVAILGNLYLYTKTQVITSQDKTREITKPMSLKPLDFYKINNYLNEPVAEIRVDRHGDLRATILMDDVQMKSDDFIIPSLKLDVGDYIFKEAATRPLNFSVDIIFTEEYQHLDVVETENRFVYKNLVEQFASKLPIGSQILDSRILVGENTTLYLSDDLKHALTLDSTVLTHGSHNFRAKELDKIGVLHVLCDLASAQLVDGDQAQLLRTSNNSGPFFRPYYISPQRSVFQSLRVYIKTDTGLTIHFDPETYTRAVLHFRQC